MLYEYEVVECFCDAECQVHVHPTWGKFLYLWPEEMDLVQQLPSMATIRSDTRNATVFGFRLWESGILMIQGAIFVIEVRDLLRVLKRPPKGLGCEVISGLAEIWVQEF